MRLSRFAVLAVLPFFVAAGVPEPQGYRMDDYNAPVPDTLSGATAVDAVALAAAIKDGAVVIDVLPAPRRPAAQRAEEPWIPEARKEVPGSLWWPEIGRGGISPALDQWFRRRLTEVTHGNADAPVAFYCKAACWMSWNAGKRAVEYGYRHVLWFGGGVEAWLAAGYPTQNGKAEEVPAER